MERPPSFWTELELRRLLNDGRRLAAANAERATLQAVAAAARRRLDALHHGDAATQGARTVSRGDDDHVALGNPSAVLLGEYERRVSALDQLARTAPERSERAVAVDDLAAARASLMGLRRRRVEERGDGLVGEREGWKLDDGGRGDDEEDREALSRMNLLQDELTDLLLVKAKEMKQGAEVLHDRLQESNRAVDDVDAQVEKNVGAMALLRTGLRGYVRASFFGSLRMWFYVALALLVWVAMLGVILFAK